MTIDQALLAQLRSAFESADPVPPEAVAIARSSLSWRDPDTALADLIADSLMDAAQVRTRRAGGPRLLTFEAAGLVIEVEVAEDGESRRLLGQLVPPSRAEVVVTWPNGQISVNADEIGRFSASDIPAGQVSLTCTLEDATVPVTTSWVNI
ncbi:MAG: hypothetical protein J2P24_05380 [Streptosporangiales bacterium]|nr:hypothetical protein [Streptosporangiales bacterium]MBO0890091.1 hypothetical protein [Acidothermales bacterium]